MDRRPQLVPPGVPVGATLLGRVTFTGPTIGSYDFLLDGNDFDSIHPSLQRQTILNMEFGLFEVVPDRIYQVRGFDLANISFIRSDAG